MNTDVCLVHLEGFACGLSDFPVGVTQHAHQAFQELWQVLQHVDVWYAGQNTDPADQELPLVGVDHRQVLPQLWNELIQIQGVTGGDNVLITAAAACLGISNCMPCLCSKGKQAGSFKHVAAVTFGAHLHEVVQELRCVLDVGF